MPLGSGESGKDRQPGPAPSGRGMTWRVRAFVVDYDPATRDQITAVLTRQGATVSAGSDAERVLALAAAEELDLIVCSEQLQGLSGLQLCQRLRALGHAGKLLLLCSLPLTVEEQRELCVDLGCDAVLSRPFRLDAFEDLLGAWGIAAAPLPAASPSDFELPAPPPVPTAAVAGPEVSLGLESPSAGTAGPPAPLPLPLPVPVPVSVSAPMPASIASHGVPLVAPRSPELPGARLLPPGVSRFGDLASLSLPRLLYELYVGVYFGVLRLERQGIARSIYFWSGVPVRVDAEQLQDSLGRLLRDEGRIDEVEYARAKQLSVALGEPLGVALVKLNILTETELLGTLARQTERKLISMFAWRDGRYTLSDDTSFAATTVIHEVSTFAVIWRGVHAYYDLRTLMTCFTRLRQRYIVATELFPTQAEAIVSELRASPVTPMLDGRTTFEQAIIRDPAHTLAIGQALYSLLVTDMIRPSESPGQPAPVLAAPPASTEARPLDYDGLVATSERIAREYLRLENADYFSTLGLEHNASATAVAIAFAQAVARIRAEGTLAGLAPADLRRVQQILARLDVAHDTLADADKKRQYLRELEATSRDDAVAPIKKDQSQQNRAAAFHAEHLYQEGVKLLGDGDHQGALVHLKATLELRPQEATYRVGVAKALLAGAHPGIEDPERLAFSYLEEALRLDPTNIMAALESARLCVKAGLWSEAQRNVAGILARAPEHPAALALAAEIDLHRR
jgi:CheY-like chemotaxis protein